MKSTFLLAVLVFTLLAAVGLWHRGFSHQETKGLNQARYTDLVGRTVWLTTDVRRIVLPRSKDIYLLASLLGEDLPDRLIAWGPDLKKHDAGVYRQLVKQFPQLKHIPVTGSVYTDALDAEQMVQLRPDLIILDKFMLDRGYKYTDRLEAAGLPVIYLDSSNDPFTGPQKGLILLGRILGQEDRARQIADYVDARLETVLARVGSSADTRPTVYLEQGSSGPQKFAASYGSLSDGGAHTSWGTILQALKVTNIADGVVDRQAPINPEYILKRDPDIIVITGQVWSTPGAMQLGYGVAAENARPMLERFLDRPGWQSLTAVKNKKVFAVFHNTAAITVFSGIQALGKYCYPERFTDLDPELDLRQFYKRFMPMDYSGTWMCRL